MSDPGLSSMPTDIVDPEHQRVWRTQQMAQRTAWMEGARVEKEIALKASVGSQSLSGPATAGPSSKLPLYKRLGSSNPSAPVSGTVVISDDEPEPAGSSRKRGRDVYEEFTEEDEEVPGERGLHKKKKKRSKKGKRSAQPETPEQRQVRARAEMLDPNAPYSLFPTDDQISVGKTLQGKAAIPEIVVTLASVESLVLQVKERATHETQKAHDWGSSSGHRGCVRESADTSHLLSQSLFRLDAMKMALIGVDGIKEEYAKALLAQQLASDYLSILRDLKQVCASQVQRDIAYETNEWNVVDALLPVMTAANKAGSGASSIFEQIHAASTRFVPDNAKVKAVPLPPSPFFSVKLPSRLAPAAPVTPAEPAAAPREPNRSSSSRSKGSDWTKNAVCRLCGGYGHVSNQCSKRQRSSGQIAPYYARRRSSSPDDDGGRSGERYQKFARERTRDDDARSSKRRAITTGEQGQRPRSRSRSRSPSRRRAGPGEQPE